MKTYRNLSGRALPVPNHGDLAPGETFESETNRGFATLLDAGLLGEEDAPKKKEGAK